ncbi:MAG: 50S ribosomal protein L31 [Candidatus Omnitrophica bacterium]|nr:50S ribosomal protein L31 [Candidatus Omnitrophota bacterium]MBI5143601.1 50S ribosomal protein L31 [Candidatus Omnitrophota bacterium]
MKDNIHPEYKETTISCVCGEVIHTRSTKQNIHVDICSKCHPFFTGKQKLVDSAGRVEKFTKRYAGRLRPRKVKAVEEAPQEEAGEPKEESPEDQNKDVQ